MNNYQQRVINEKFDLDKKISSLGLFILGKESKIFDSLGYVERSRLLEQAVVMKNYSHILGMRIIMWVNDTIACNEKVKAEPKEERNSVRENKDRYKSIHCRECFGYEYSYNSHICKGHDKHGVILRTCTLGVCLKNRLQEQELNKPDLPKPPPDRVLPEDGKE